MPRNLVVCFDGTNNQFGRENTNVVRLVESLVRGRPNEQLFYYDPGVGTLPEPWFSTRTGKWLSKAMGLAFGAGLLEKVERAYIYLMNYWERETDVYLF